MIDAGAQADLEFSDLFRDEANERLDSMVDTLLALRRDGADPEAIDSVFRDAHTIKGGSAMLGLRTVQRVAHAMEDVLAASRTLGECPEGHVELLLHGTDALRRHVAGDDAETPELLDRLGECLVGPPESVIVANGGVPAKPAIRSEPRSVRIAPQKIDRLLDLVAETVLHRRRLEHVIDADSRDDRSVADELDVGGRLFGDLKDAAIQMRMLPLATVTSRLPRAVHDVALAAGKDVQLIVDGDEIEVDRAILDSLAEPLVHAVRNAVGHGIESAEERAAAGKPACATVELTARQRGGTIEIVVADDGRGVSAELLAEGRAAGSLAEVLARPGFSTAAAVTELSGRGVGLDAVKRYVEGFGGTLEVRSETGAGTEVIMVLPLALALLEVLLVERAGHVFGLPLASVDEVIGPEGLLRLEGRRSLELRGRAVPLADLADLVGSPAPALSDAAPAIVIAAGGRRRAAACDRLLGQEDVVVKPLGPLLADVRGYLGAAILGDGRIALLLDPSTLTRLVEDRPLRTTPVIDPEPRLAPKILVVEDSFTVRELQRSILEAAGYRVEIACDGRAGLDLVAADAEIDLVVTDLEMPRMNGLELTRAIRGRPESASLPVVIVTSMGSDDDRRTGVEAGANAYMVKRSFNQHALLETVERLVGR